MTLELKRPMMKGEPLEVREPCEVEVRPLDSRTGHPSLQMINSGDFSTSAGTESTSKKGKHNTVCSPKSGSYSEMSATRFAHMKKMALKGADFSKKGSIDAPIIDLIEFINFTSHYFTTSSCSGRTIVVSENSSLGVKKKGCLWLYVTHDAADPIALMQCLRTASTSVTASLKFEPMIMHVQCANVECARHLMQVAVASGFRNSGLSLGKSGKIILAVRSTAGLEVPLMAGGKLLVAEQYVEYLVQLANYKMESNMLQISRFFQGLQQMPIERKLTCAKTVQKHNQKTEKINQIDESLAVEPKPGEEQFVESLSCLFDT